MGSVDGEEPRGRSGYEIVECVARVANNKVQRRPLPSPRKESPLARLVSIVSKYEQGRMASVLDAR